MDLRLNVNKKIEDQSQEKTGHFLMELQSLSASSNFLKIIDAENYLPTSKPLMPHV